MQDSLQMLQHTIFIFTVTEVAFALGFEGSASFSNNGYNNRNSSTSFLMEVSYFCKRNRKQEFIVVTTSPAKKDNSIKTND